jgi:hypothetical protein
MSIFELIMLLCFGAAWPVSIYKSLKAKSIEGKSVLFLYIILTGYIAGITHKILYSNDFIVYLYILNGSMVLTDILLYHRNKRLIVRKTSK